MHQARRISPASSVPASAPRTSPPARPALPFPLILSFSVPVLSGYHFPNKFQKLVFARGTVSGCSREDSRSVHRVSLGPYAADLLCRVPAVHHENRPGEERGIVAGHESKKSGDFFGGCNPADWVTTSQHVPKAFLVSRLFGGTVHERSIHG